MARGGRRQLVLAAALVLLHFTLRPLLVQWPGAPDLLVGGLLLGALRMRSGAAAGCGFALGLLEGSMALEGLGITMIVYTATGYAAARARDLIFTDARIFLPLYLFAGTWLVQAAVAVGSGPASPTTALLALAPLSAALTTVVCWMGMRLASPYPY